MTPAPTSEPDLDDLFVDEDEQKVGTTSPFFAVYRTPAREERYGWYCSNCDGLRAAVDAMGRIECTECGNCHRPRRWDAAYL